MKHFEIYKTPKEFDNLLIQSEDGMVETIAFIEVPHSFPKIGRPIKDTASVREWLSEYFGGKRPLWMPKNLRLTGVSEFTEEVISLLMDIPYGEIVTYGELAKAFSQKRHIHCVSSQAVGGAVGRNPIAILIPCHRVLGAGRKLTGYHGGLKNKEALLNLEGIHYEK